MYNDLRSSPYLRVAEDAIPDQSMFAYKYLQDHLLSFAQKDLPLPLTKQILRDSLRGIAALHEKGIVRTDIKANNIMVDWDEEAGNTTLRQVQNYRYGRCCVCSGRLCQRGTTDWELDVAKSRGPRICSGAEAIRYLFIWGCCKLAAIEYPSVTDLLEYNASML